ncbi:MAG: CotH kinase family protein [Tannerella sp.]|jgi:hypothetical protein|nr:CotH kinase family protein [Tannerella sp.]
MANKIFYLSVLLIHLLPLDANAVEEKQLTPDGQHIKIIGTQYSVNYDSNTASETVNTKSNAFDGNFATYFASYDRSYTWLGLDLGEKHVITKVSYSPRRSYGVRLQLGVFEGANQPDFGDAVPLGIITTVPSENVMTEQSVTNSRGFRYVRYIGPNDVRCNIAEVAFYGFQGVGDDSKLTQITGIPDVIIHTVNAQEVTSKETYLKGIVSFISENGSKFYSDSLEIRGRGNASWGFPKKPYRLKLFNSTSVLGHPAKGKNWTLINNFGDKTLMRNLLAFDISKRFEMPYTPAGRPVNVFFNGEYKGCYQFCDHIDIRKNRVDIDEMGKNDISGDKLTGGYLIEIDAYATSEDLYFHSSHSNIPVTIKSPDYDDMSKPGSPARQYIINRFSLLDYSAVYGTTTAYQQYLDIQTFIRHFLVGELAGNTDTYWSTYLYKPRNDDKFYVGPVWDFDIAFENDNRTHPIMAKNNWLCMTNYSSYPNGGTRNFINRIVTNLRDDIKQTWAYYRRNGAITEKALLKTIDDYANEMDESQKLNFIRWKILNSTVHQNFQALGSYSAEVQTVRNYITERIKWIDNLTGFDPVEQQNVAANNIYAWSEHSLLHVNGITENVLVEVFDIIGKCHYSVNTSQNLTVPAVNGFSVVKITSGSGDNKILKIFNR